MRRRMVGCKAFVMPFSLIALTVFVLFLWATVLLWLVGFVLTLRGIVAQRPLAPAPPSVVPSAASAPLVSVLIPARNEEHRVLRACLLSILNQDYPALEIIAVNDRSTDATGAILHALARTNPKLQIIDGAELPAGWLGKPYALAQALRAARGSWILATDADMIYAPQAVRTAVVRALDESYDAVTLLPDVECRSFWERVFMPTFGWYMLMAMPLDRVNDAARAEAIGVGGFFLIKQSAIEAVGGYDAVRGEVAEDLRMAELLKMSGARLRLEYAPALISTRMQTNLREIWEGFTKNLFAGAKFSLARTFAGSLAVFLFAVAPPLVAASSLLLLAASARINPWVGVFLPAFLTWLLQVMIFAAVSRSWKLPPAYALTVPLGHALFTAILLNSAVKIITGRGVMWKGRKLYEREGGVRPPSQRGKRQPRATTASRRSD